MAHYSRAWWYSNDAGTLATNQRAIVFGPGDNNTVATIYADAGLTTPLPNPTTTDPTTGVLSFHVPDNSGTYWIFVGPQGTGDSERWDSGGSAVNPVLTINGQPPDGAGDATVTAADVGAVAAVATSSVVYGTNSSGGAATYPLAAITTDTLIFTDDRNVLTTGGGDARWYNRTGADLVIVGAWVSCGIVPTGADLIVDVNLNGTTIYTTQANRPTVPGGTNGGTISATPDVTALDQGDYLTVDIDQIGASQAGGRLTVGVVVHRAG